MRDSATRLSNWFPIIEDAGLPVPRTIIIRNEPDDLWRIFDGEEPSCLPSLIDGLSVAAAEIGLPFFLRTDFTSGKHDWERTCLVSDLGKLANHIVAIAEYSALVDPIGLPTDVWVVRELLKTKPLFCAFGGRMPIVREFRFFVHSLGLVDHVQPYWPPQVFEDASSPNWRSALDAASAISARELGDLKSLSRDAAAACSSLHDYWSVDWLQDADGDWWLTDMAEGEKSYQWSAGDKS